MKSDFKNRIRRVQSQLGTDEALVLYTKKPTLRNRDVEYPYRQDSDFYYLTGLTEPSYILFLKNKQSFLFSLPFDPEKARWEGGRKPFAYLKTSLGLTECLDIKLWDEKKLELLTGVAKIWHFFGREKDRDLDILQASEVLGRKLRDGKIGPSHFSIPEFLHVERMVKNQTEIGLIQEAVRITGLGIESIMKSVRSGMFEYQVQADLESVYKKEGARDLGFSSIVASGNNATTLHYTRNDSKLKETDLLLVDTGAEYSYYTADVTRVFPVGRKFSSPQKDLYNLVLHTQKEAIQICHSGSDYGKVHQKAVEILSYGLRDLKIIKKTVREIIENGLYKKYYMHNTGHYLGLDVHDVGRYFDENKRCKFKNGTVLTVEPGLYLDREDESIPKHFRGIGIRIEDDVLIHGQKPVVLTGNIPKEIDEIEALRDF